MQLKCIWDDLTNDSSATSGIVRRRIAHQAVCDVFLAVQKPEDIRVLQLDVAAQSVPPGASMPRSRGFEIQVTPVLPGSNGIVRLTLLHTLNGYPEIFSALCDDIVQSVEVARTEKAAVSSFIVRLTAWQRFLERQGQQGLSPSAQLGLYGELLFLARYAPKYLPIELAIDAWTGPLGTNQDFELGRVAVEVKTTRANTQEHFHVSSERQFDTAGLERLLLFQLAVDVRQGEDNTLPQLVSEIRGLLAELPAALLVFNHRLLEAGYLDAHASLYMKAAYTEREHRVFQVREGFPRITEADLRDGVGRVNYTVSIAACLPFLITVAEFADYFHSNNFTPTEAIKSHEPHS